MCLPWRTSGRKADILTRDLLLNNLPRRCSGGGQQSATVVLLFTSNPTYGGGGGEGEPLPNAAASLRTDHNSVAVTARPLSEDTRWLKWSGAKSIRYSMNIM